MSLGCASPPILSVETELSTKGPPDQHLHTTMRWTGICIYAHGGMVSAGLLLSTVAALTATLYAAASCRFVVLEFTGTTTFEEALSDTARPGPVGLQKVGLGLFGWLRAAVADGTDWSTGTCAGYTELMLDTMESDTPFGVARIMAVLAVVLAVLLVLWTLLLFCLELMNTIQVVVYCALATMGAVFSGCTVLLKRSRWCTDAALYGTERAPSCKLDEGALVLIAGLLLWISTALLGALFLRPSPSHKWEDNDENERPMTKREKERVMQELEEQRERRREERRAIRNGTPRTAPMNSPDSALPRTGSRFSRQRTADSGTGVTPPSSRIPRSSSNPRRQADGSRIPRSSSNPTGRPQRVRHETHHRAPRPSRRPQSSTVVDDVYGRDQMEVYLAKRLDRIQALSD